MRVVATTEPSRDNSEMAAVIDQPFVLAPASDAADAALRIFTPTNDTGPHYVYVELDTPGHAPLGAPEGDLRLRAILGRAAASVRTAA